MENKINVAELLSLYKESKSPREKSNIWFNILECIKDISIEHNPDCQSGSLYWDEDSAINLNNEISNNYTNENNTVHRLTH